MCRYESLIDGTLGLHDLALMNDMLMMVADNQYLAAQANKD